MASGPVAHRVQASQGSGVTAICSLEETRPMSTWPAGCVTDRGPPSPEVGGVLAITAPVPEIMVVRQPPPGLRDFFPRPSSHSSCLGPACAEAWGSQERSSRREESRFTAGTTKPPTLRHPGIGEYKIIHFHKNKTDIAKQKACKEIHTPLPMCPMLDTESSA